MPFDTAILDGDFTPMNHRTVQPISAKALRCFDETGQEIPGFHHIVNGETNKTIRVAPDSYTLVQNDHAVDLIEQALTKSKLDLTDARFGADYSHDGARMFAQWIIPAHTVTVRPGIEASLRVVLLNSYDGTTALHARAGSFNWVCANTSVTGREFGSFKFRHTGEIDLAPAVAKLANAAEDHAIEAMRWARWPGIAITDQTARAVLSSLPAASDSQVDALVHAWLKARDEDPIQGGANLWCLFNVLTNWATRGDVVREVANRAQVNWDRSVRVAKVVEGKLWSELAAA